MTLKKKQVVLQAFGQKKKRSQLEEELEALKSHVENSCAPSEDPFIVEHRDHEGP